MYNAYVQRAVPSAALPADLQLRGVGWPAGGHFLVSEVSGEPIDAVLRFLRHQYGSRVTTDFRRSARSVESGVYDLKDFFDFLDASGLEFEEVRNTQLENYLFSMISRDSPTTGRAYSRETVRRRASTIRSFYQWASDQGITKYRLDLARIDAVEREFRSNSNYLSAPRAQKRDAKVRYIPREKLRLILDACGPLVVDARAVKEGTTSRLRLMYECALQAGLRRAEIPRLTVADVRVSSRLAAGRELLNRVPLDVLGKGAKVRTVMFPVWIIENIAKYIDCERAEAIAYRRHADPSFEDHGFVFVREASGTTCVGEPFDERYLSGPIRQIQMKLGIRYGISDSDQPYQRRYGVHALRHTYALVEYFSRKEAGDPEPWLFVQAQLGHSDLSTTTGIYLSLAREYEYEFGQLLKSGLDELKSNG